MNTKQLEVSDNLERLVHHRMTEQDLNKKLSEIFGSQIEVEKGLYDEDWQGDDYYTFCVDNEEIGGYFDIYYISMPHRPELFYITEVIYCFE